jgi:hypothetical protein
MSVARSCIYAFQGATLNLAIAISLALIRRRKQRQVHFGSLLYNYAGLADLFIVPENGIGPRRDLTGCICLWFRCLHVTYHDMYSTRSSEHTGSIARYLQMFPRSKTLCVIEKPKTFLPAICRSRLLTTSHYNLRVTVARSQCLLAS